MAGSLILGLVAGHPAGPEPARRRLLPQPVPLPDGDFLHRDRCGLALADEPGHGRPHERFQPALYKPGPGFSGQRLAHHPHWGIAAIALAAIWQMSGYTMALYLGGLRAVPDELREAARVDGASEVPDLPHIILPTAPPGHPERDDHPGTYLAQGLRPDHGRRRQAAPPGCARHLHVADHL